MTLTWDDILSASSASCNVTIVCSDGTILSHKIIVATASDFLKRLMRDTDDKGEDITILLPDFNKDEVKNLFSLESLKCVQKDYFSIFTCTFTFISFGHNLIQNHLIKNP